MKPVSFLPSAKQEMIEAADFYGSRVRKLGVEFARAVEEAVMRIQLNPRACPTVRRGIRMRIMIRFPYAIVYRDFPDSIIIVAIAHMHRRPGYWSGRT
jgi:plasmid stabilization system protein ParE